MTCQPDGLPAFLRGSCPDKVVREPFPVRRISRSPQPSRLPVEGTWSGQASLQPIITQPVLRSIHAISRPGRFHSD